MFEYWMIKVVVEMLLKSMAFKTVIKPYNIVEWKHLYYKHLYFPCILIIYTILQI